jgi:lipopolysaccharide/colanic/teichoic acid biosynthesis glycosyltransferase
MRCSPPLMAEKAPPLYQTNVFVPRALITKRVLDVVASALGLLFFAPCFALIAWLIRRDSPGPAFYTQVRCGQGGRPFRIYKFRSMTTDAEQRLAEVMHLNLHVQQWGDARMYKIVGDPRVTRLGTFLRRYSVDELPQLLNVLKGEMSLVGPRPLTPEEDQHVPVWARARSAVRPGLTGVWQVQGRNAIPFDEMMRLDSQYVRDWSFLTDVKLLLKTIPVVARPQDDC